MRLGSVVHQREQTFSGNRNGQGPQRLQLLANRLNFGQGFTFVSSSYLFFNPFGHGFFFER